MSHPYESPAPVINPAKKYATGTRTLQFKEMLLFAFSNPNWLTNVMWCSLCFLVANIIPVLPHLIVIGYLYQQFERLHLKQDGSYEDFDTSRLGDYLTRSIWLLLAYLILTAVMMVVFLPIALLGFGAGIAFIANDHVEEGIAVFVLTYVAMILVSFPLQLVTVPVAIRVGLSQQIAGAFSLAWIKEFVRLTWREILLGGLVLTLANILGSIVGLLFFCIGAVPVMVVMMFAYIHFQWQLYEIYLERGGTPIPLKPKAIPVATVVPY
jgi:hypothetical protein